MLGMKLFARVGGAKQARKTFGCANSLRKNNAGRQRYWVARQAELRHAQESHLPSCVVVSELAAVCFWSQLLNTRLRDVRLEGCRASCSLSVFAVAPRCCSRSRPLSLLSEYGSSVVQMSQSLSDELLLLSKTVVLVVSCRNRSEMLFSQSAVVDVRVWELDRVVVTVVVAIAPKNRSETRRLPTAVSRSPEARMPHFSPIRTDLRFSLSFNPIRRSRVRIPCRSAASYSTVEIS